MNLSIIKKTTLTFFTFAVLSSCTEQYVYQNQDFEDALTVEATLTNELKYQEINVSRTRLLNDTIKKSEPEANVTVVDSDGNIFQFNEKDGKYISANEFKAEPNKNYQLKITTKSGKSYVSSTEVLPTQNSIDLEIGIAEKDGARGVQVNVKSFDPANTSKYYRYEYEETYKIITPYNIDTRLIVVPKNGSYGYQKVPAEPNTQVCYTTKHSTGIRQTSTVDLTEDRVKYPVRFISDTDYMLTNRYSIMVSQYTQNESAYDYYYKSKKIIDSGELLSPNQPGYVVGNIKSTTDFREKVVGYFEVASVSKKRIFFSFKDFFPSEKPVEYFKICDARLFDFDEIALENHKLLKTYDFLGDGPGMTPSGFYMVEKKCGDCTSFSSNVTPSFWEN
ncbi:DUF4249 domain-containing protein [Flavobacterium branchiicola]|uniref:DUF4249 domain-containing protein n=1 Tax=Flavobacterium branchiicola TaxID=1114875 RepID=A0ABV9P9C0_9FLAO|nr:DUF4249 domain-containing protein [Flavobacterium branchiicola]MBS7252898.1 DUF4249 domain-containing protein [Flavobacterium branchiicola]